MEENVVDIKSNSYKMINFGHEFEEWDDKHKIEYLKKLASSMNHAADLMQQERDKFKAHAELHERLAENAHNALAIQKDIVMKNLTDSNLQNQENIKIIQKLQAEIRQYKKEG